MRTSLAIVIGVIGCLALATGCDELKPIGSRGSKTTSAGSSTGGPAGSRVKLEFYIMSKCPFGVQVAQGIKPVLDEIGDYVDFHMDYIVSEQNGQFQSLHGEPETKGNIVQLCAMKHYPELRKYMGFIDCWNQNWREIPEGWEACADRAGLDKGRIRSCADGNQGKELLRESMKRAQTANAQGSPTILLAGEAYNGERGRNDFLRAICDKIQGSKPAACSKIPEEPEVEAIVLSDKRCAQCATQGLEQNLKMRFFPKLKTENLDYGDAAGKKLYKEFGLKYLPVMLFKKGVEQSSKYAQIERWMEKKGEYMQLRIPANFDPTAEICDNKIDDTNDGKVDCDDATCKSTLVCRKEIPRKLDVFVMSQCPYGLKALDAMKEILEAFKGDKLDFSIHYIADKTADGFNALHGQPEVDENIRELCAIKHYGANHKYMEYIWCRNKNINSTDWKPCATGGISADVIEKCFSGAEGKKLLEEDIKIAKALDVSGSPTWLANNKFKFNGIAPEPIKAAFCEHNKGLAGCAKKLSDEAASGAPSGSCGGK